jgi:hypothetical protein
MSAATAAPTRAEGGYGVLALAVLCISVGSIFVRLAAAPPLAVAFYRIGLATLILAPFATRAAARALPSLPARHRLIVAGSGIALGLHFATWIASLSSARPSPRRWRSPWPWPWPAPSASRPATGPAGRDR